MCSDPACDSPQEPPVGERWCRRRLDIELARWFLNFPMEPGKPRHVADLLPPDDPIP